MSRVLHLKKVPGKPGEVYYPLQIKNVPIPKPGDHEILIRLAAAALNHKDLFTRRHQYPAISFDNPLLADGCGTVVEAGPNVSRRDLLGKLVILTPMRGWESDPVGPEGAWATTGASRVTDVGAAQDYIVVHESEVELAPAHLSPAEAAALPLVGLTGWRALVTKAGDAAAPGKNILITGIGGGVALQVLQFAVALGANVYVTSGDQAKIDRAEQMGAKGGVIYKDTKWEAALKKLLPKDRPFIDAIIDGAGGDIVTKGVKVLRQGGIISQYGMTVAPKMNWSMVAVLGNMELRGSTMGSKREFREMIAFVSKHKIKPVVSRTVKGLDNIEAIDGLFAEMDQGKQFGKLVIEIDGGNSSKL